LGWFNKWNAMVALTFNVTLGTFNVKWFRLTFSRVNLFYKQKDAYTIIHLPLYLTNFSDGFLYKIYYERRNISGYSNSVSLNVISYIGCPRS